MYKCSYTRIALTFRVKKFDCRAVKKDRKEAKFLDKACNSQFSYEPFFSTVFSGRSEAFGAVFNGRVSRYPGSVQTSFKFGEDVHSIIRYDVLKVF